MADSSMLRPDLSNTQTGDRERRLLLIVDSNNAHLYYTSLLLQRLEYDIQTAKSAEDALECLNVASPALILSECALSGMDGLEFLKKIKRNPNMFSQRIIMMCSSNDPKLKDACKAEGCADFLRKPVDPDVLYAAVQKATEVKPRKYIRLNTCLNVVVGDDKAAPVIDDYITALSENGMFISTSKTRATGIDIPITIFLENAKIKASGLVLYSFQRGEGPLKTPGMGIKFTRIEKEDQVLIRSFIQREITKGISMGQVGSTIL